MKMWPVHFFGVARRWPLLTALVCLVLPLTCRGAGSAADTAIVEKVSFDQNLGAQVPSDAPFKDTHGQPTSLGKILGRRSHPAVLVLGYHECPMLCSLVLSGLVESFNDLRMTAGEQFEVIDVSIKPGEETTLAASQERVYLKRYGRGASAGAGWHFLTGDESSIRQLADTVGFHYQYDPATKQYAHASGIVILTPDGKVSRYFFGINYEPHELGAALISAGAREISSPIEKLLLLCFHYNPINGKYGAVIMNSMRAAGAVTLAAVLALIGSMFWRERRAMRNRLAAGRP